uniref:Uncharacterized protein n=1 Tax=Candidatus Kentrum sp. UNK TaxID=2126344 RepID=A0A451ASG1_9GAMM|nr:MAG: hypothetical protein BECKUNK1418G_GA0071005_12911 [Candidatus Kentron sp. UNK]VFK73757.1 MAG: hypothetical protein BECKUNK1418H_GA0071006_12781 [Candidatus Kentron sp. UNK]
MVSHSDQFLGRLLKKGGRDDVIRIMNGVRELGLAISWLNGLELKKMTLGRGINRNNTDLTPDEELARLRLRPMKHNLALVKNC